MKPRITVSVDQKTYDKLKVICAKEDRCMSKVVERLLKKYLEEK